MDATSIGQVLSFSVDLATRNLPLQAPKEIYYAPGKTLVSEDNVYGEMCLLGLATPRLAALRNRLSFL